MDFQNTGAVAMTAGEEALARLVEIAVHGHSGQSARVGNFLLAWWNASRDGGFDFTHLWNVDEAIMQDMLAVIALFSRMRGTYASSFGYGAEMETLVGLYSQNKRSRKAR